MVEFQTLTLILECVASACLSMSKHRHDILPAVSQLILLLTLLSPRHHDVQSPYPGDECAQLSTRSFWVQILLGSFAGQGPTHQ